MRAIRSLFALLFLVSLGFSLLNISGNQSSYNPGDILSLTLFSENATDGEEAYVNLVNASRVINCSTSYFDINNITSGSCIIPTNLANGSWNITVSKKNTADTNSSTFILNYTVMGLNISPPGNYSSGSTFTVYVNMSYQNNSPFNMNTSAFNFSVSANISCSLSLSNSTAGNYTSTCDVNNTALAGIYTLSGTYPNAKANDTFGVNISYRSPRMASSNQSFSFDNSEQRNVTINITSWSNYPDIINVTHNCDGTNLTCSLNSTNATVAAFANFSVLLTINSTANAVNGTYTVSITVLSLNETSKTNQTNISVTINPFHNFSVAGNLPPSNNSVPAGATFQYGFNISSKGNTTTYSFSCNSSSVNFTCIFNYANSTQISEWTNLTVSLNVTVLNQTPLGEVAKTDVYATDAYGLRKQLSPGGEYFTTTAAANLGGVTVTNVSQYVHYAGETYYFNISVNNTGNIDNSDTLFNITITAQNTTSWTINVSNDSSFANSFLVNSTNGANLNLSIGNLSSKNISIKISVPAGATYQNSTRLFIKAVSALNASRASENSTIIVKLPSFNFLINMAYNRSAENLSWYIVNISREPGINLTSFSSLNYTLVHANGTVMSANASANISFAYSNSTLINTTWSGTNYSLNINGATSDNYNFSFSGLFYISRWVGLTMSVPATSNVVTAVPFNATVTNTFEGTGVSLNLTSADRPVLVNFYGTSGSGAAPLGGSCSYSTMTATTYIFTCTPSTLTNTTSYYLNATSTMTSCSRDFSCTFMPSLTNMTYTSITEVTSLPVTVVSNQTNQQTGAGTNTTTNQTTVISTAGLRFTIPSGTINLQNNSYNFSIVLNNTNSSRQNLSVTVSETGAYLHFRIAYVAPRNISGNSVSSLNITLTPFKWSKPGTYTVSVRINLATMTLTVAVPQPNDTKIVHRYIEVSNDRTLSNVTLVVKNRNAYSVIMNITENLPKQIAQSISNVTILSDLNYTIVESDPVIMWNMNMSPNQERTISYSLKGDLGDSNLFNAPTPMEARITAPNSGGVTTAGGGDWTTIIIVIVVLLAVAGGAVFYFFFMKKRGEKMPFNYAVFLGEVKKEKGILSAIKNLPHALMSAVKGKAKEEPKPTGLGIGKKIMGVFGRLKRKKTEEKPKEELKKEDKKEARAKPSKEELLDKLKEVYKK